VASDHLRAYFTLKVPASFHDVRIFDFFLTGIHTAAQDALASEGYSSFVAKNKDFLPPVL
jgi:hypothetical protein